MKPEQTLARDGKSVHLSLDARIAEGRLTADFDLHPRVKVTTSMMRRKEDGVLECRISAWRRPASLRDPEYKIGSYPTSVANVAKLRADIKKWLASQ